MEQMKMHFHLEEGSSLLQNLAHSSYRTHYSPVSITVLQLTIKLPSSECVLAASVYLTCNDGCSFKYKSCSTE